MLLNDLSGTSTATLTKINQYLTTNYGFSLSSQSDDAVLESVMDTIHQEIADLKVKGNDAKLSPEISKRLLILEGVRVLRENAAAAQLQSPDLEPLVSGLVHAVVNHFRKCGQHEGHLEDAIARAMDEYRGSEYLFPDDYIEDRIRSGSYSTLSVPVSAPLDSFGADYGNGGEFSVTAEPEEITVVGNDDYEDTTLDNTTRGLGMMNENTRFVKHLRTLLETEVSQAEVMMAAKGFSQELQEMVEKIGRLQNEDLPPVTDQMRETYGTDSASAFQTQIYGALQGVMDSLYTAKNQVDDAVTNMATTGSVSASVDMDKDVGIDDMATGDLDLDNIGDEPTDDFGGADVEEPLGHELKESAKLKSKIAEMQRIVQRARKLKESRQAASL